MGLIASDFEKNICLFMYQPQARESFGGLCSFENICVDFQLECIIVNQSLVWKQVIDLSERLIFTWVKIYHRGCE